LKLESEKRKRDKDDLISYKRQPSALVSTLFAAKGFRYFPNLAQPEVTFEDRNGQDASKAAGIMTSTLFTPSFLPVMRVSFCSAEYH